MYDHIAQKLARGETIILDGGTGTDIQRRGAAMRDDSWCAEANREHPDIVQQVHEDYVRAGAEIVIANTFATSPLLFNALGRDADLLEIDQLAVAIARRAVAGHQVAIAGSISTTRSLLKGSGPTSRQREWPEQEARALFQRKADNLAGSQVDLLMMEMMRDVDYSIWATQAAIATGLPVWIGISVQRRGDGKLAGFGRDDQLLDDVARVLAATRPAVISIMHTMPDDTDEALDIVRTYWDGPLGAYPESGFFRMPEGTVVASLSPEALVQQARAWRQKGVTIFGGCCGFGPAHIRCLAQEYA